MKYAIDLIILIICVLPIAFFAKKGFVYALVKVVGFVVAFVLAISIGNFSADYIYNNVIAPNFASDVKENIDSGIDNVADSVFESLPEFIKDNSEIFGFNKENFTDSLSGEVITADNIDRVLDVTVKPIVIKLLSTLITLVAFIILVFVVGILSNVINKLFSFSVIGTLNKILGGIIGLPMGVILSVIFCYILDITLTLTSKGLWIFDYATVNSSKLYNLLMSIF